VALGSNYLGSAYLGQGFAGAASANAALVATFAGASSGVNITNIPATSNINAFFTGAFSPEGFGVPGTIVATFTGASAGIVIRETTAGTIVATFTGASATGTPVVYRYSTQSGNQFVTDITSYGLHANVRVYVTVGVPTANLGNDGDFALRRDAANGSGTQMYHRASGAWSAVA
jgi:hypothetical protein